MEAEESRSPPELEDDCNPSPMVDNLGKPSAIEQRAIVPIIEGRDVIVQAQTVINRITVLPISVLQKLDMSGEGIQALVLTPNRGLAQETRKVIVALGDYMNVECHACIGGTNIREDVAKLKSGIIHIVVGTPGRVLDMINRSALRTDSIRILCVDEADEMLSRGFEEQLYDILRILPKHTQIALLTGTILPEVSAVTKKFMRDPLHVVVKSDPQNPKGVKQFYIDVGKEDRKFETLCDIDKFINIPQAVIFCNTRHKVDSLAEKMRDIQVSVSFMHADMDAVHRAALMEEFRSGSSQVLIATDLLARGIDAHGVPLVLNYDLPVNRESYINRIGRFRENGVTITFVTTEEIGAMRDLEAFYEMQIGEVPHNIADFLSPNPLSSAASAASDFAFREQSNS